MEIIKASVDDARAIAEVHVCSWQAAYRSLLPEAYLDALSIDEREAQWLEILLSEHSCVLAAVDRDEIKAFLRMGRCRDEDVAGVAAEIMALYVTPGSWRQGIGRALLREAYIKLHEQAYQGVTSWVIVDNISGRRFFQAMGFEKEGNRMESFELAGVRLTEQRFRCCLA